MTKIKDLKKQLKVIFSHKEKNKAILILLFMVFCAAFETFTAAMMLPFANSLLGIEETGVILLIKKILLFCFGDGLQAHYSSSLAFILAGCFILKALFRIINIKVVNSFTLINQAEMSARLFRCYLNKPYSYHITHNSSEILRAVTTDVANTYSLVYYAMMMVSELLVALVMLTTLVVMDPIMMLFMCCILLLTLVVVNFILQPKTKKQGEKSRIHNVLMLKNVRQSTGALKTILASKKQDYFINEYEKNSTAFASDSAKYNILATLPSTIVETICMVGILIYIGIIVFTSKDATSIIPSLATLAIATIRLMPIANRVSNNFSAMSYRYPSMRCVYEALIDSKENEEIGIIANENSSNEKNLKDGIDVNDVSFKFSSEKNNLFNHINLHLPAKKSTAFIGVTGAGKTTLADIILGLQKPINGSITVDGRDISQNANWWAHMIGYIPQHIYIMDDTIRNNVAFGVDESEIDDQQIWKCLKNAQLADLIHSLPNGLNTVCGEAGVRFSGGQIQRLGIARALYDDPQFLVLDEATSALDSDTEHAIIEAIDSLSGQITLLIIAHRLTTIQNCDVVYRILPDGVIKRETR